MKKMKKRKRKIKLGVDGSSLDAIDLQNSMVFI
jgi:hypothetical protein